MSNLNVFQQVFSLNAVANAVRKVKGNEEALQKAFQAALLQFLPKLPGWAVSWGPKVWVAKPTKDQIGPDGVWFAAMCKGVQFPDGAFDTCVVAIAGTGALSESGGILLDFGVDKVVAFNDWTDLWTNTSPIPPPVPTQSPSPGASYCAYGTAIGVYQMLIKVAPVGTASQGTTILQYIQTLPSNCRVILTGHSLGGALSPTLALGLMQAKLSGHISLPTTILSYPTAGASPGNSQFSIAYSKYFPTSSNSTYQNWNADFYNTLDIVPQAWCTDASQSEDRNLQNILTIYGTLPPVLEKSLQALINLEKRQASKSGLVYIPLQGKPFRGPEPSEPDLRDFLKWFRKEALKQHIDAYRTEIGNVAIDAFVDIYSSMAESEGVSKLTLREEAATFPILRFMDFESVEDSESYPYDQLLNV